MKEIPPLSCPLCLNPGAGIHFEKTDPHFGLRRYFRCSECRLIFLDPEGRLSRAEETLRYDGHTNSPRDPDYVNFLKRLSDPLSARLRRGARGLDYGCGPGPTLSVILGKEGFVVENYDPIYFPDESLLSRRYDFLTCSETAEHFSDPRGEFERMTRMLEPTGGALAVMTQVLQDEGRFADWWYHRDPTHIAFYQKETFEWIARWLHWRVEFAAKNVMIFSKKGDRA